MSCRIDDIIEQLRNDDPDIARPSIENTRDFTTRIYVENNTDNQATKLLEDPIVFFAVLCRDSRVLLKAMYDCNAVLGGFQATSFFFPVVTAISAPWDFYCSNANGDPSEFILRVDEITGFDMIEDKSFVTGERTVHYRGNFTDLDEMLDIRIFISNRSAMEMILDLESSLEQSAITATVGICFWPRLTTQRQYKVFEYNGGHDDYPIASMIARPKITNMNRVRRKSSYDEPVIYGALDKKMRIEVFDNEIDISQESYDFSLACMTGIVYAVYNSSTRYLGTVGAMK